MTHFRLQLSPYIEKFRPSLEGAFEHLRNAASAVRSLPNFSRLAIAGAIFLGAIVLSNAAFADKQPAAARQPEIEVQSPQYVAFKQGLKDQGANLALMGNVIQPFFSVKGKLIKINSTEIVQVFEYPDNATAAQEAKLISSDASSIGDQKIDWQRPPHFYAKDNLIILYQGQSPFVLKWLQKVMGAPVAQQRTSSI